MTRKHHLQALCVVGILLLGLVWRVLWMRSQADEIYETVVRSLASKMTREESAESVAFISINDDDPAANFLQRFSKGPPEILPASRGIYDGSGDGDPWLRRMADQLTQRKGQHFELSRLTLRGLSTVRVQVDRPGTGEYYFVKRQSGKWEVVNIEMAWIN